MKSNRLGKDKWDEKYLGLGIWCALYYRFDGNVDGTVQDSGNSSV